MKTCLHVDIGSLVSYWYLTCGREYEILSSLHDVGSSAFDGGSLVHSTISADTLSAVGSGVNTYFPLTYLFFGGNLHILLLTHVVFLLVDNFPALSHMTQFSLSTTLLFGRCLMCYLLRNPMLIIRSKFFLVMFWQKILLKLWFLLVRIVWANSCRPMIKMSHVTDLAVSFFARPKWAMLLIKYSFKIYPRLSNRLFIQKSWTAS